MEWAWGWPQHWVYSCHEPQRSWLYRLFWNMRISYIVTSMPWMTDPTNQSVRDGHKVPMPSSVTLWELRELDWSTMNKNKGGSLREREGECVDTFPLPVRACSVSRHLWPLLAKTTSFHFKHDLPLLPLIPQPWGWWWNGLLMLTCGEFDDCHDINLIWSFFYSSSRLRLWGHHPLLPTLYTCGACESMPG